MAGSNPFDLAKALSAIAKPYGLETTRRSTSAGWNLSFARSRNSRIVPTLSIAASHGNAIASARNSPAMKSLRHVLEPRRVSQAKQKKVPRQT